MRIYITKWALTRGILEVDGDVYEHNPIYFKTTVSNILSANLFSRNKEAFDDLPSALANAVLRFEKAANKAKAAVVETEAAYRRSVKDGVLVHLIVSSRNDVFNACLPFPKAARSSPKKTPKVKTK